MNLIEATPAGLAGIGVDVAHHFAGGAYIKSTNMPKGTTLGQHAHPHAHLSVLVKGTVRVTTGAWAKQFTGFRIIEIKAHIKHSIEALTDCIWLCVWSTDDTDSDTVDQTILKG